MIKHEKTVQELLSELKLTKKKILTFDEACSYTGFSKSYMYKLTHRREIPFSQPNGKLIFFERKSLEKYLLQNKRLSKDEIDVQAANHILKKRRNK